MRVVAVFGSLQIVNAVSNFGSGFWPLLLFVIVIVVARLLMARVQTSPRYVWLIVSLSGHVAGFAYKSFFFSQMQFLGLTTNAGTVFLAIPLLLLQGSLIQLLLTGIKYAIAQRPNSDSATPTTRLSKARLAMASTDIRDDAFAATTGYLVYAAVTAVFKSTTEEMHHLFEIHEPPCFQTESGGKGNGHRLLSDSNHTATVDAGAADSEQDLIIGIVVFLVLFLVLPIAEYYLHQLSRQQKVRAQSIGKEKEQNCWKCVKAQLWHNNVSGTLGIFATAVPWGLGFQGHALIISGLFEKLAHNATDEASEILLFVVLAVCALGGFFLATLAPSLTDTNQEALSRRSNNGGDGEAGHANTSCSFLYRVKMLTPSHKEFWAVWVGLLYEVAVACANFKSGDVMVARIGWIIGTLLLFVASGYFMGGAFAEIFEHHLHEQMAAESGNQEGTTEGTEGTEEMLNPLEVGLSNAHAVAFEKRKTLDQVGEESSDELQALDSSSSEEKSSHLDRSGRLGVMKRKQNEQQ